MFTQKRHSPQIAHHKPVFCLFGIRAFFACSHMTPLFSVLFLIAYIFPLVGCSFGQSKKDPDRNPYADQAAGVFSDSYDDNAALNIPDADDSTQWTIVLVTLPNSQLAAQVLNTVQSTHGLVGATIQQRAEKFAIAYGRYAGPDDIQAKLDLDRVRELQSGSSRPFAGAYLAPPPASALTGSNKDHDLRTVKQRFGPQALYTLQLGVYGTNNTTPKPNDIKEFRRAAEQAVLELRAQGERAFYYHAPLRSMVTVGVFGEADFDGSTTPAIESFRLIELRKRYPHNYLNGQGIRETITTDTGQRVTRLQPSALVAIPKK